MNPNMAAILAQVFSSGIYATIARWHAATWLRTRERADALIPLLWVHAFRYVALHLIDAQATGYAISDGLRDRIIYGDLVASVLAVLAIAALRARSRLSIPLVLLLLGETVTFIATLVRARGEEATQAVATGINWLVQSFYVPLIPVTVVLILWQLISRRGQPLAKSTVQTALHPQAGDAPGRHRHVQNNSRPQANADESQSDACVNK
jgi:hypothetical protein